MPISLATWQRMAANTASPSAVPKTASASPRPIPHRAIPMNSLQGSGSAFSNISWRVRAQPSRTSVGGFGRSHTVWIVRQHMARRGDDSFRPCTLIRTWESSYMQDMPGMICVRRHPQRFEHQPPHPPPAQTPSHRSTGRKPPIESSLHAPHFAIVTPLLCTEPDLAAT